MRTWIAFTVPPRKQGGPPKERTVLSAANETRYEGGGRASPKVPELKSCFRWYNVSITTLGIQGGSSLGRSELLVWYMLVEVLLCEDHM